MQRFGYGLLAAIILLWVANLVLSPVPIGSAFAVGFGLIAAWTAREGGLLRVVGGTALGIVAGVLYHRSVHRAGLSPDPAEGIPMHLGLDALMALSAAVPILLILVWLDRRVLR